MFRTILLLLILFIYAIYMLPAYIRLKYLFKMNRITQADYLLKNAVNQWSSLMLYFSGTKVTVSGYDNIKDIASAVFAINHSSIFDIPVLLHAVGKPVGFISKIELKKIPLVRQWMKFTRCVFMDRSDIRQSLEAIKNGAEIIKKGYSMAIFPEGKVSKSGELLEFKPGSLKLAYKSEVPIIPVCIKGTNKIKRGFKIIPVNVEVIFSKPITPDYYSKMKTPELASYIKSIISGNIS